MLFLESCFLQRLLAPLADLRIVLFDALEQTVSFAETTFCCAQIVRRYLPPTHPFRISQQLSRLGKLGRRDLLPLFLDQFFRSLLYEFRCCLLLRIEVVLDVAVARQKFFPTSTETKFCHMFTFSLFTVR
jgi:hypothetical protein